MVDDGGKGIYVVGSEGGRGVNLSWSFVDLASRIGCRCLSRVGSKVGCWVVTSLPFPLIRVLYLSPITALELS